jgi:hypothetical protein
MKRRQQCQRNYLKQMESGKSFLPKNSSRYAEKKRPSRPFQENTGTAMTGEIIIVPVAMRPCFLP